MSFLSRFAFAYIVLIDFSHRPCQELSPRYVCVPMLVCNDNESSEGSSDRHANSIRTVDCSELVNDDKGIELLAFVYESQ